MPSTPSALAATAAHLTPSSSSPSLPLAPPTSSHLPPTHRLAAYGTLRPGQPNEHKLAHLGGRWIAGTVRGRLVNEGWGAAMGSPGLHLSKEGEEGEEVELFVLESEKLEEEWEALDALEGDEYERVVVGIKTAEGVLEACIYALKRKT